MYLTLEEISSSLSHSRVDVGLRCLDVVVEIITKSLDVRNDIGHSLRSKVSREEDWENISLCALAEQRPRTKSDVADLSSSSVSDTWNILQLKGWIVPEEDLRGVLDSSPSCVDELLDKDLAEHSVGLFPEDSAEDDGNSVVAGLDINGLLLSVVNGLDRATLSHSLRSLLGCKLRRLLP